MSLNSHDLTNFRIEMYVGCEIYPWKLHTKFLLCIWLSTSWMSVNKTRICMDT
jgi:hypothetical protein